MSGALLLGLVIALAFAFLTFALALSSSLSRGWDRQPNATGQRLERLWFVFINRRLLNESATRSLREDELVCQLVQVNVYQIAQAHLVRRHQVREWIHQESLHRSLQVPGAVFEVEAFFQQHFFGSVR